MFRYISFVIIPAFTRASVSDVVFVIGLCLFLDLFPSVLRNVTSFLFFSLLNIFFIADAMHTYELGVGLNLVGVSFKDVFSSTFINSYVFHEANKYILVLLLSFVFLFISWKYPSRNKKLKLVLFAVCAVLFVVSTPGAIYKNIVNSYHVLASTNISADMVDENAELVADSVFAKDLSGNFYASKSIKPNILFIIIEGLSLRNAKEGYTPLLKKRKEKAIWFNNFYSLQHSTNRGEFSILCGELPNLLEYTPKMDLYNDREITRKCLPKLLAENGYSTEYIQAADLTFMNKDKFMPLAGFSESHGIEYFKEYTKKTSWGVDDKSFFIGLKERITVKKEPWFIAALNVGTHGPYDLHPGYNSSPDKYKNKKNAFLYLDNILESFLEDSKEVLDNTLIFISSDESTNPINKMSREERILNYRIPLVILSPKKESFVVDSTFSQSDLALSVSDYLGIKNNFRGRSVFREYQDNRPVVLGNWWEGTSLLFYDKKHIECSVYRCVGNGGNKNILEDIASRSDVAVSRDCRISHVVAHAGGKLKDKIYTNSIAALENSYQRGLRYFEIDFVFTSDDKLVLLHDWGFRFNKLYGKTRRVSSREFLSLPDAASLDMLLKWIDKHPDAFIITDVKEHNLKALGLMTSHVSQIIPQIFHQNEYEAVKHMGFSKILYTLYKEDTNNKKDTIRSFISESDLFGVVVSKKLFISRMWVRNLRHVVNVYVHSIGKRNEACDFISRGVHGVYSHILTEDGD